MYKRNHSLSPSHSCIRGLSNSRDEIHEFCFFSARLKGAPQNHLYHTKIVLHIVVVIKTEPEQFSQTFFFAWTKRMIVVRVWTSFKQRLCRIICLLTWQKHQERPETMQPE